MKAGWCFNTAMSNATPRRRFLRTSLAAGTAVALGLPALASSRRSMPAMTEGPFYPPRAWRERWDDWDADLSRVQRGGQVLTAKGEALGIEASVVDTQGRVIDDAEVGIWQCDATATYHHPNVRQTPGQFDPGFQGFGATRSAADGTLRFRTIKPVPYPGRTPHIHLLVRHASFGKLVTQLFVAGDPGNQSDFLWSRVREDLRSALTLQLQPAPADSGLRWQARHTLVVPA